MSKSSDNSNIKNKGEQIYEENKHWLTKTYSLTFMTVEWFTIADCIKYRLENDDLIKKSDNKEGYKGMIDKIMNSSDDEKRMEEEFKVSKENVLRIMDLAYKFNKILMLDMQEDGKFRKMFYEYLKKL